MMAREADATNEELLKEILECFSEGDNDLIVRAWDFAETHYSSSRHPIGKPYVQYALRVAKILVELGSAPIVIAAALLFPPLPLYASVLDNLMTAFLDQPGLVRLVEELFSLSHLEWDVWPSNEGDRDARVRVTTQVS